MQEREKEKQAAAQMREERKRQRKIRKSEESKENKKTCKLYMQLLSYTNVFHLLKPMRVLHDNRFKNHE